MKHSVNEISTKFAYQIILGISVKLHSSIHYWPLRCLALLNDASTTHEMTVHHLVDLNLPMAFAV